MDQRLRGDPLKGGEAHSGEERKPCPRNYRPLTFPLEKMCPQKIVIRLRYDDTNMKMPVCFNKDKFVFIERTVLYYSVLATLGGVGIKVCSLLQNHQWLEMVLIFQWLHQGVISNSKFRL